ncbi:MAG: transporter, partial [Verrucomicrobiota bacterium]
FANEPEVEKDKSVYHLFNPTPTELMRDLSTDRPDKTESPYTVDAGHIQIEADIASYSRDHESGTRVDSWSFFNANLKVGLCNNSDLQLVVPTYSSMRARSAGNTERNSGFGDLVTRLKINFWGNDGGKTAFAAMPFVKFPTAQDDLSNGAFEGGIIFPLAVELPREWGMGLMTEFDFNKDESGGGHHAEFINSITFSHQIVGDLAGYAEFFSSVSAESDSDWIGTIDVGLVYALTENIQLDAGMNFGITRAADDFNPFAGITIRF